ncbi:MAG: Gfo/Idh/MocA family oxidoreductase, partial [Actinomycetia bacterium]|nr:Gfo/Idh/MocA family oxidoreductase [Actinomycetes bacterium]
MTGQDDLRIGIAGLGQRSYLAGLVHRPGNGSRVVAGADPDPLARARFADSHRFGADLVPDHTALLDRELDAVIVSTPDDTH